MGSSKTMIRKTNNWISPRHAQSINASSSSNLKSQSQLLNSQPQRGEESITESLLSEEIRSVKLDLHNQNVIRADTQRARFITKENHVHL